MPRKSNTTTIDISNRILTDVENVFCSFAISPLPKSNVRNRLTSLCHRSRNHIKHGRKATNDIIYTIILHTKIRKNQASGIKTDADSEEHTHIKNERILSYTFVII